MKLLFYKRRKSIAAGIITPLMLLVAGNAWVILHSQAYICHNLADLVPHQYGLVLGASPRRMDGSDSQFFHTRIATAAYLYKHQKVKKLILSGGHDRQYYNEPEAMKKLLMQRGVPEADIILDIHGINTLTSISRAKEVLAVQDITIITQRFHSYRAAYIGQALGMNAIVFTTDSTTYSIFTRVYPREILARVKALLDVHIIYKTYRHSYFISETIL